MLSIQGLLLFSLVFFTVGHGSYVTLAVAIIETLLLKAVFVPFYLHKVIKVNHIKRETEPYVPHIFSLFMVSLGIGLSLAAAFYMKQEIPEVKIVLLGGGIAMILCGMFVILSRKKIITHVMGYCVLENGIFLLSLSAAKELPVIVSLGVALDAFICVLLAGILVKIIRTEMQSQSIDELKGLKN
jgi:hydrogenase-4 component E